MPVGRIEIQGLRELLYLARRSTDQELPKRIGQAHKSIGALVIARLRPRPDPAAVGKGGGAAVRPSASKREVLLRVGGKHRAEHAPEQQWGKRLGRDIRDPAPPRPYIRETVERNRPEIESAYLQAVAAAFDGPFETET